MKRTKYDAPAPIVKPCSVDVSAIWERKKTVSEDLMARVLTILNTPPAGINAANKLKVR